MSKAAIPSSSNAAFPWRHPHNQLFHVGSDIPITDSTSVNLGIRHKNFTLMVSLASLVVGQLATSVSAEKIPGQDGSFLITARDAAGAQVAFGTPARLYNGTQLGPYNITPGETTKIKVDGGTTYTKTWAGTRAIMTGGAATYAALNGLTLTLTATISPGISQSITTTLDSSCTNRATTITYLNTTFAGVGFPVTASAGSSSFLVLTNTAAYGTAAQVLVGPAGVSNTALAALGLTANASAFGTGDAAFLGQTTATEAAAALNTVLVGATAYPSGDHMQRDIYVYTTAVGTAASLQLDATSTQSLNMPDNAVHSGTGGTEVTTCYANFFVIEGDPGARY